MTPTLTDRRAFMKSEGCPWAEFDSQQLYLAVNDKMADFGFAFGHGEFDREKVEWNLGVVSQNLKAGKIPPEKRLRYFPNTMYPGLGIRFNMLASRYIRELRGDLGINAIDVSPSHYHLVFLNRRLGAQFDLDHRK